MQLRNDKSNFCMVCDDDRSHGMPAPEVPIRGLVPRILHMFTHLPASRYTGEKSASLREVNAAFLRCFGTMWGDLESYYRKLGPLAVDADVGIIRPDPPGTIYYVDWHVSPRDWKPAKIEITDQMEKNIKSGRCRKCRFDILTSDDPGREVRVLHGMKRRVEHIFTHLEVGAVLIWEEYGLHFRSCYPQSYFDRRQFLSATEACRVAKDVKLMASIPFRKKGKPGVKWSPRLPWHAGMELLGRKVCVRDARRLQDYEDEELSEGGSDLGSEDGSDVSFGSEISDEEVELEEDEMSSDSGISEIEMGEIDMEMG